MLGGFFTSLGYSADVPEVFERDLAALLKAEVTELGITGYGQKLSSRGLLIGPNGRQGYVLAIWIILFG